ncbi:MAG: SUF system NifU family Fe-S cluster assembly protein [Gemmatimonadales bacterium]|nr:SUF system NifU family Fe-S cluster assembly protein [Gemmatimonadales bacterium]
MIESELSELYQAVILDHNRAPRNCRRIADATCTARGLNPHCGDEVRVFVKDESGVLTDVSFEGSGCAISRASASLMTTSVKGKTRAQALDLFRRFHDMVATDAVPDPQLGKLAVFSGVRDFPSRVKCASLAWHALRSALTDSALQPVTTAAAPNSE